MSFGDPNNPYGRQPGQGYGQDQGYGQNPDYGPPSADRPGYGYPQQGQSPYGQQPPQPYDQPQYGYPQPPTTPVQPYGGYPGDVGYGGMPPFAHWGLRFGAAVIDGLISSLPYVILNTVGTATNSVALIAASFVVGIGMFLWLRVQEGSTGQTPGKKAVGIKVLRQSDGATIGFGMAIVRQLAHILDMLPCYLGYLWPLWDEKKQTFADKVCATVVIKA
ncbi:RDD family protein [Streptomyces sp. NPDC094448]|uniref:RDD family protein n=1 Tax=Streptomyces sp. NPDC094448 TaxID=3366063 RepID=UPI0037F5ACA6